MVGAEATSRKPMYTSLQSYKDDTVAATSRKPMYTSLQSYKDDTVATTLSMNSSLDHARPSFLIKVLHFTTVVGI
jgi:hypothetical protein